MKQIWSGTQNQNGTITVSEMPYHNVFAVQPGSDNGIYLFGVRIPNTDSPENFDELHCFGGNDADGSSSNWMASFKMSGTSVALRAFYSKP